MQAGIGEGRTRLENKHSPSLAHGRTSSIIPVCTLGSLKRCAESFEAGYICLPTCLILCSLDGYEIVLFDFVAESRSAISASYVVDQGRTQGDRWIAPQDFSENFR